MKSSFIWDIFPFTAIKAVTFPFLGLVSKQLHHPTIYKTLLQAGSKPKAEALLLYNPPLLQPSLSMDSRLIWKIDLRCRYCISESVT